MFGNKEHAREVSFHEVFPFVERIVDSGSTRAREGDTHKESPFWTQGFREVVTSGVRPFVRVQSSGFDP